MTQLDQTTSYWVFNIPPDLEEGQEVILDVGGPNRKWNNQPILCKIGRAERPDAQNPDRFRIPITVVDGGLPFILSRHTLRPQGILQPDMSRVTENTPINCIKRGLRSSFFLCFVVH